jgi:type 2 lantibiotic biosynthesis protein LanM
VSPADVAAAQPASDPSAQSAIRAWNQAFSPGDESAFLRRLSWDGLDLTIVLAAAADPGPPAAETAWVDWLDRTFDASPGVGADIESGHFTPDPLLHVPFEEIWTAFRRVAAAAVGHVRDPASVTETAMAALERQLCVELSRQGELALFELFQRHSSSGYRAFVARLLDQGLLPFFLEYPSLARRLAGLTGDWVAATREFLDRFDEDAPEFASLLGATPGAVVSIEPGVSDPHHGRRRVAIVQFESGSRLVYKPRSLALDVAFNRFLQWMNSGLAVPVKVLRVLDRGSHGWVEFAAHAEVANSDDAARYFQRSGALMAVAWLLGAVDLHMENIVASADGPVLVDTEMLCQPVRQLSPPAGEKEEEDDAPDESVLSTGLLSLIEITAQGEVYDSGGLRGQLSGPLPFPARVWHGLGTDGLHYVNEPTYRAAGRHQVLLAGTPQDPGDYAPGLLAGFNDAYRCLLDRRGELLAPGGPLGAFAGSIARVVLRPTDQYAMLDTVLCAPRYQRSGVPRSTAVDVLHRVWAGADARPALWAAAIEERRAIDRLDVPHFSARCDGADLLCGDRVVVAGHFAQSGLAATIERVKKLSDETQKTQAVRLARTLGESVTSRFAEPPPDADREEDGALAVAEWIARELRSRARETNDGLTWPYLVSTDFSRHRLYDGALGPALFFAALAAVRQDDGWRRQALAAFQPIRIAIEREPDRPGPADKNIGGMDGLGSIVYGFTVASALLGAPELLDPAWTAATRIRQLVEADTSFDVLDGAAGAALAPAWPHSEWRRRSAGGWLVARGLRAWRGRDGVRAGAAVSGDRPRSLPAGGDGGLPVCRRSVSSGLRHVRDRRAHGRQRRRAPGHARVVSWRAWRAPRSQPGA